MFAVIPEVTQLLQYEHLLYLSPTPNMRKVCLAFQFQQTGKKETSKNCIKKTKTTKKYLAAVCDEVLKDLSDTLWGDPCS